MKDELFICEECGHSSPIANEDCSVCGGKMIGQEDLTGGGAKNHDSDDLDADFVEPSGGFVSLEAEKSKEEEEEDGSPKSHHSDDYPEESWR